jgi:frataxin-like iron-binding protein CyaY
MFGRRALLIALTACLAVLLPVTAIASLEKAWRFRVFLDDKEIGYHHFHLMRNGDHEHLTTEAEFEVSFLGIPLFTYSHKNVERWSNQCLQHIASSTDENGKQFRVEGNVNGEVFQLTTHSGSTTLPACVSTFAYWDKSFLEHNRLLNSQTGDYLNVEVEYLGPDSVRVRNTDTSAHRYKLSTDKAGIELWYSQDDHWVALQSTTRSGRVLRYIIE